MARREPRALTYRPVGITAPSRAVWTLAEGTPRCFERSVHIGRGDGTWIAAAAAVMRWSVKTRSGFTVDDDRPATPGADRWLEIRVGPIRIREPVRVVSVVDQPHRVGFAYGTLDGHPVSGEEAFIVHRTGDEIWFTLRSVTAPGRGLWRLAFPMASVAQRVFRRRYLAAMASGQPGA